MNYYHVSYTIAMYTIIIVIRCSGIFNMQRVTIQPGHATYEQLQGPTLPIWKSIYFFNLTNGPEFEDGKEIPRIVEVGPYSYRYVH